MRIQTLLGGMASLALLGACQGEVVPLVTVAHVDLERFMGDWYVIACIPTYIEKGAHNPLESYRLEADGTIATTFTFRAGGFEGKPKVYKPRGFVVDRDSNAIWGMQFMWPIKADYRIMYLDEAYGQTIIGRQQRDYLWIMARTPQISDADYQRLVGYAGEHGYDLKRLQKMPQQWH